MTIKIVLLSIFLVILAFVSTKASESFLSLKQMMTTSEAAPKGDCYYLAAPGDFTSIWCQVTDPNDGHRYVVVSSTAPSVHVMQIN